jgi:hypothetical protein
MCTLTIVAQRLLVVFKNERAHILETNAGSIYLPFVAKITKST